MNTTSIEWHGINLKWAYCELLPAIYRDIRCRHKAHDILHDALLKFALSPSTIQLEKPHAYLRVIAQNLANEDRKCNQRLITFSNDSFDLNAYIEDPTRVAPSPEELTSLKQRLEALQRIINRLPPKCREAFWRYRIEQQSLQQIAEQLSISVNMVSRHITRAMLDLTRLQDQVL